MPIFFGTYSKKREGKLQVKLAKMAFHASEWLVKTLVKVRK